MSIHEADADDDDEEPDAAGKVRQTHTWAGLAKQATRRQRQDPYAGNGNGDDTKDIKKVPTGTNKMSKQMGWPPAKFTKKNKYFCLFILSENGAA